MTDDFEWNERKRLENFRSRNVDFREATGIFDGLVIEVEDRRANYGERRFRALGFWGGEYYVVVYTWRGEKRRIISALRVGEHGRRRYQTLFGGGASRDAGEG
jgi:uncharacterized DUF497 family protein